MQEETFVNFFLQIRFGFNLSVIFFSFSLNIYLLCSALHSMIIHHPKKQQFTNKKLKIQLLETIMQRHTKATKICSLEILFYLLFFHGIFFFFVFAFWKGFVGLDSFAKLTLLWFSSIVFNFI